MNRIHLARRCLMVVALAVLAAPPTAHAGTEDPASGRLAELREMSIDDLMRIRVRGFHHIHAKGEWMLGYKYMFMGMNGNRSRSTRQSRSAVLADYMIAPLRMDMQMHMAEVMYAPSDSFTLMVMIPYHVRSMDHVARNGARFTTRSKGIGDISLMGHFLALDRLGQRLTFLSGVSFPSGSINERDNTPMGRVRLPYPMQLGSGTFDPIVGIAYQGTSDALPGLTWGVDLEGVIHTGRNDKGYRLGHGADFSGWLARDLLSWMQVTLRIDGSAWGNIHGSDSAQNPAMVPTADPDKRAGRRIDLMAVVSLLDSEGPFGEHQLDIEGGAPIYQWLDGPQLETDWRIMTSWAWTF